jgi:hypothetical protein
LAHWELALWELALWELAYWELVVGHWPFDELEVGGWPLGVDPAAANHPADRNVYYRHMVLIFGKDS